MLGYKHGRDLYANLNDNKIKDEDINKYYITIYDDAYYTDSTADKLNIPFYKFIKVLNSCGAVKNSAGCLCFTNKEDTEKAILMLKLML